jgi:hypothetical protein
MSDAKQTDQASDGQTLGDGKETEGQGTTETRQAMIPRHDLRHEIGVILARMADVARACADLPDTSEGMEVACAQLSGAERRQFDQHLQALAAYLYQVRERVLQVGVALRLTPEG